jgi:hypothetical protein
MYLHSSPLDQVHPGTYFSCDLALGKTGGSYSTHTPNLHVQILEQSDRSIRPRMAIQRKLPNMHKSLDRLPKAADSNGSNTLATQMSSAEQRLVECHDRKANLALFVLLQRQNPPVLTVGQLGSFEPSFFLADITPTK